MAAGAGNLGIAPLVSIELGIEQQADHADDTVHRGPDFMAHGGHKFTLGEVGLLSAVGARFRAGGGFDKLLNGVQELLLGPLEGGNIGFQPQRSLAHLLFQLRVKRRVRGCGAVPAEAKQAQSLAKIGGSERNAKAVPISGISNNLR